MLTTGTGRQLAARTRAAHPRDVLRAFRRARLALVPQCLADECLLREQPFVNLCIFISQAAFQAKWDVGISGRVGVSLFFCIEAFAHGGLVRECRSPSRREVMTYSRSPAVATFFLADKLRFLRPLERGLKQIRVAVILEVFQVVCMLLMALVQSVSANVGGCKDPTKDGNADLEGYVDALPGFCRDKRASAAFFWLNFCASFPHLRGRQLTVRANAPTVAWSVSLALTFLTFARVRRNPRSTGFAPPGAHFPQDDDEAWARPSFDEGGAAAAPRRARVRAPRTRRARRGTVRATTMPRAGNGCLTSRGWRVGMGGGSRRPSMPRRVAGSTRSR